jgi:hypothetical protein
MRAAKALGSRLYFRVVRVRPDFDGILVQAQKMQSYDIWNLEIPMLNGVRVTGGV